MNQSAAYSLVHDPLMLALQALPYERLGCVVHIGAGYGQQIPAMLSRGVERLVVVEGDPATRSLLRSTLRGLRQVGMVSAAVSDRHATLLWRRYNLMSFNGLLSWERAARSAYPRLIETSAEPVTVLSLTQTLASIELPADGSDPNVLVVDVPGQCRHWLEGLHAALRGRFAWLLVRGFATGNDASSRTDFQDGRAQDTADTPPAGWRFVRRVEGSTPWWPVTMWQNIGWIESLERAERGQAEGDLRLQALQQRVDVLEHATSDTASRYAAMLADRDVSVRRLAQGMAAAWLEQRRAEQASQHAGWPADAQKAAADASADPGRPDGDMAIRLADVERRNAELMAGMRSLQSQLDDANAVGVALRGALARVTQAVDLLQEDGDAPSGSARC